MSDFPTFAVRVHDFKDDPQAESISLHGPFTDEAQATEFADAVRAAYPDFLVAEVVPFAPATIASVAQTQRIGWVPGQPGEGGA